MMAWKCAAFDSPYYDPRHRELAERFSAFLDDSLRRPPDDLSPKDRVRAYVRVLADGGWLRDLAAAPGDPRPDVRAIGLLRQALSHFDDLADCAYSIQGLGLAPISQYGSEALKERFVAPSLVGRLIGAFAITEPSGGSDPANLAVTAELRGDYYVLNGRKAWISHVGLADYYCVFATTHPGMGPMGVSCLVVPADTRGLTLDTSPEMLAARPIGHLEFADCAVPKDHLVGRPGFGFRYAMEVVEMYRITLASAAVGTALRAMQFALERSKSRAIGGKRLFDHQLTKDKVAEMSTKISAASLLAAHAAWVYDKRRRGQTKFAATAKYFATEAASEIVDQALQLFGAEGLAKGNPLEALYRQVRSARIYEGTSEMQKLIIADAEG